MKQNKKKRKKIFALILLLAISVGYALLSTTLSIVGTAGINNNVWDIHWDDTSVVVNPSSVSADIPLVSGTNDNTVTFSADLELPGDYYEFTVDAINEGTIDGIITLSTKGIYDSTGTTKLTGSDIPSYINYTVTYDDDTEPALDDVLKSGESQTYKIRVEFDSEATTVPANDTTYTFKYQVTYEQYKDPLPQPRTCSEFEDDSWDTINSNVIKKTDTYPVGCEKDVDLGTYGVHRVRVTNNTTPDECLNDNFSQTACGFVLEFVDNVSLHRFNPRNPDTQNGHYSKGGWEYSEMRTYVNSDIYNALPSDLKSKLINTKVVSSHEQSDSKDFVTLDKVYIPSTREVLNYDVTMMDSAANKTRQFDYYNMRGATLSDYSSAIKAYNGVNKYWWTRSAMTYYRGIFSIMPNGNLTYDQDSENEAGVSPVFRLGKEWVLTNGTNPLKNQKWEYYLNPRKKLETGWYQLKDFSNNDQYYYFENGFMKLGWHTENNRTYYLSEFDGDNNNYVDGNRVHDVTLEIDGVSYTFDSNGVCTNCN